MDNKESRSFKEYFQHFYSDEFSVAQKEMLDKYGQRYVDYRNNWDKVCAHDLDADFPVYIMLEQTYKCNLSCPSCVQGMEGERDRYDFDERRMPWELYEKIILEAESHGCPSIAMHNNDEPLLVPDLEKRIRFARDHGFMDVIMTTNAIAFTEKRLKSVIDSGVTKILFSIDALTEETYDKVRPGGDFNKVVSALKQAVEYRNKSGSALPIIRASFCATSSNEHEVKDIVNTYRDIADYVDVQPFIQHYDFNNDLVPSSGKKLENFKCTGIWSHLIIRGNGDVLPCPNFLGAETVLGNIKENSIYEIYNSEKTRKIKKEFSQGIYSQPGCQACVSNIYRVNAES